MTIKNLDKKARAYALKNAIAYDGTARMGSVISSLFNEGLKPNDVKKYSKKIGEIVAEVNNMSLDEQKAAFSKLEKQVHEREGREGLPDLPNAKKGKVIMRFAPAPSAPLHIGHAMTASISYLLVKKYGGKFYLRIEDTDPDTIEKQFYNMIKQDGEWLFNGEAKVIIQSERMEMYYDYAEKLLKKEAAYVCTCTSESFKEYVDKKVNCSCRKFNVKENLARWNKMFDKNGFQKGEAVLRFKSKNSMQDKNPAMRDFPLARINTTIHPLQGNKYRVWPLMNLAVCVDDIDLRMTHVIRAKDHRDNAERQKKMFEALGVGKKFPWTSFLGRIKFKDIELSKRKLKEAIKEGTYSGWDDPKIPTLISLRKQGYKASAFWKFAERVGLSENDKVMDRKEFFTLLDDFNKD